MRVRQLQDLNRAHPTQVLYFHEWPKMWGQGSGRVWHQRAARLSELQHGVIRQASGHAAAGRHSDLLDAGRGIGSAVSVPHAPAKQSMEITQQMVRLRRIARQGI